MSSSPLIDRVDVSTFVVPTDAPESDGTIEWTSTTMVLVELEAAGVRGLGYTYASRAAATLVHEKLAEIVQGSPALDVPHTFSRLVASVRNLGRPGLASEAISAIDVALWDLKAKLLDQPLVGLLGAARDAVPVYGSGGFTSYDPWRLAAQLSGWADEGISMVKMKVGRDPAQDLARVRQARAAIGDDVALFVDANGAYARKQALLFAEDFEAEGVSWFEEPVSSDDLEGLRMLRDRAPVGMDVAAGEYGYDAPYFRRMLAAGAVDVLQADASRCLGITGFLAAAALADAFHVPLSAHCAPSLHAHVGCALPGVRHLEWFHDHVRIERMLFDGALTHDRGLLRPDRTRPGLGLALKSADARRWAA